jgi:hypothetical protein
MTMTLNLSQFAFGLGSMDRLTLDASLPFHRVFHKATEEQQASMRRDFVTEFVRGNLNVSVERVLEILAEKRSMRNPADELAVNAAGKKFKYHVVREVQGDKKEVDHLAAALRAYAVLTPSQKRKFVAQM